MKRSLRGTGLLAGATTLTLLVSGHAFAGETPARAASRPDVATVPAGPLPLGPDGLAEQRTSREIEPGLAHTTIVRGASDGTERWTVTVGFAATAAERDALLARLRDAGFEGRADAAAEPAPDGSALGWMIRTGSFVSEQDAAALAARVRTAGLPAGVQITSEDGGPVRGPWVVNVLTIDPRRYRGELAAALATDVVPGRETTSSIAARLGATAAVNGGFFVVNDSIGTSGDLAGISVIDGALVSEAVNGRPVLTLRRPDGRRASVDRITTRLGLRTEAGAERPVDGVNRKPGLIVNCGGIDDAPFDRPAHDFVCTDDDEIIAVTPAYGTSADAGPGFQVALDRRGVVTSRQAARGGSIPANGMLLQATGESATWLAANAPLGARLRLDQQVRDERGRRVRLDPGTDMVNGGPTLVDGGRVALDPEREGWSPRDIGATDRDGFFNGWYVRRHPRTAAGVRTDGTIVLVTVEGRRPGYSVGASIPEMARLMAHLGSAEAINLDGGGSTAMVVEGRLVGRPSDATGERANGDALVLLPRRALTGR